MAEEVRARWFSILREPTVPVQVGADTFHLHRSVLQKSGFFAPILKEDWADDGPLKLDLPCSAEEFVLLVVALYTGEEVGTPLLPVPNLACALRVAKAADQLLLTDHLPELQRVLPNAVKTFEERAEAACAAPTLSPALRRALESVHQVADNIDLRGLDVNEKICSGIKAVNDARSMDVIWSMLTAFTGRWDIEKVASATQAIVSRTHPLGAGRGVKLAFAARLAAEKLDVHQAMLIFKDWPRADDCEGEFREHVLRCTRERALTTIIETYGDQSSYMYYFSNKPELFMQALQASPPDQLELVVLAMTRLKPMVLADVLSAESLLFLPSHIEALINPLLHSGDSAISKWATNERLETLPLELKWVVSLALAPFINQLRPGVAEEVVRILEGSSHPE